MFQNRLTTVEELIEVGDADPVALALSATTVQTKEDH